MNLNTYKVLNNQDPSHVKDLIVPCDADKALRMLGCGFYCF